MKDLKGKRVLVVDDEELLRELIVVQLTDEKVEAIEASCAQEALEAVHNQVVDLIISDVRMPNGDGIHLLKELQKIDESIRPEIIMMSGFSDLTEEEALKMGALKLFSKPFRYKDFFKFLNENFTRTKKP